MIPSSAVRLPTHMIVSALQRQCTAAGIGFFVRAKGDSERGSIVLIFEKSHNSYLLYEQARDFEGRPFWRCLGHEALTGIDVSQRLQTLRKRDPDLYILDIECSICSLDLDAPIDHIP